MTERHPPSVWSYWKLENAETQSDVEVIRHYLACVLQQTNSVGQKPALDRFIAKGGTLGELGTSSDYDWIRKIFRAAFRPLGYENGSTVLKAIREANKETPGSPLSAVAKIIREKLTQNLRTKRQD